MILFWEGVRPWILLPMASLIAVITGTCHHTCLLLLLIGKESRRKYDVGYLSIMWIELSTLINCIIAPYIIGDRVLKLQRIKTRIPKSLPTLTDHVMLILLSVSFLTYKIKINN
jgi:hypothetical protein